MTTAAQARSLCQPFLDRHPDFVFNRRFLFRAPLRHILVSFEFDRSSLAEDIRTKCGASVMCCPPPWSYGGIGTVLDRASGLRDRPNFATDFTDELERANREVLDRLHTIYDVMDYPPFPFPASGMDAITRSTLLTALGRFEEAAALLGSWIPGQRRWLETDDGTIRKHYRKGSKSWKRKQDGHDKLAEQMANVERLHDLLVAGRHAPIATLLHEWEAIGARTRGIERYWEPSPFPFELT